MEALLVKSAFALTGCSSGGMAMAAPSSCRLLRLRSLSRRLSLGSASVSREQSIWGNHARKVHGRARAPGRPMLMLARGGAPVSLGQTGFRRPAATGMFWLPSRGVDGVSEKRGGQKSHSVSTRARKADVKGVPAEVNSNDSAYSLEDRKRSERQRALEAAMSEINATYGKGSVQQLGAVHSAFVETMPTGCMTLDWVLGGGLPRGRIVEIYGPESSGKTTLALHAIAEVQKRGGNAMLVDAEHAFDPVYSNAVGVDVEKLIVCQPDHGEMALETADRMCRSGTVDLICIDSVSALVPRAEIEGEIGMQQVGLQARLMSQAMRKMSTNASKAGCTLIFLNQIRNKVGVVYGSPEVTSGGLALRFFASVRLDIRSIGKIKSSKQEDEVGIRVRVRVKKSKVSRPFRAAEMDIIFGEGVSTIGCILDCAEAFEVVVRKGSWYSYGEQRIGQGRDRAIELLKQNDEMRQSIEQVVRQRILEDSTKDRSGEGIGVGGGGGGGGGEEDDEEGEDSDDIEPVGGLSD